MIFCFKLFLGVSLLLGADEGSRNQILFLMQSGQIERSVSLYKDHVTDRDGKHDFELLEQMGSVILEKGSRSQDPEQQLLSLYGDSIAGRSSALDIYAAGLSSRSPKTQMATPNPQQSLQRQ